MRGLFRLFFVVCVQRAALPKEGLIPVTAESFAKWKADRAAKRIADWEAKRAEEAKRTGGRGLSAYRPCLSVAPLVCGFPARSL